MRTIEQAMNAAADALAAAGVTAYADPAEAASNRPCVLVTPPTITYDTLDADDAGAISWRLIALAHASAGTQDALLELSALEAAVRPHVALESATPSTYRLSATETCPAYVLTCTE